MSGKIISIDIGGRSINVLQGNTKGKMLVIKKALSFPTPPNSFIDGRIEDRFALRNSIKTFFKDNKLRAKNVFVTIQSTSVVIRDLTLPVAKEEQLKGAVAYEMEQYVSVDGRNNTMEFRVVDEIVEDGVTKSKVKVATMPKEMVDNYYEFIKEMKMNPCVLDVHPNSVSKVFSGELDINTEKYYPDKAVAVVDFGYKSTMINIITRGVLEFSRILSYGSRDIDMIISNYYNLSPAEAEAKKIDDIRIDKIEDSNEDPDSVYASLRTSVSQLVRELQKVMQYYTSRSSSNNVETMYIYGGGSKLTGLDVYLKNILNLNKVVRINTIGGPGFVLEFENVEFEDYVNALGAMVRL